MASAYHLVSVFFFDRLHFLELMFQFWNVRIVERKHRTIYQSNL